MSGESIRSFVGGELRVLKLVSVLVGLSGGPSESTEESQKQSQSTDLTYTHGSGIPCLASVPQPHGRLLQNPQPVPTGTFQHYNPDAPNSLQQQHTSSGCHIKLLQRYISSGETSVTGGIYRLLMFECVNLQSSSLFHVARACSVGSTMM